MQALGRFKLHILALLVVVAADAIGIQKFGIVVLLPLLYAMVFGAILSIPRLKILSMAEQERAAHFMPIAMLFLVAYLGFVFVNNLVTTVIYTLSLTLSLFGDLPISMILGLPMALLLKMGREAIGADCDGLPSGLLGVGYRTESG